MNKMEIEITSTPINDWDKHAQHPLQTTMYAMYNYEHNGCIPHYCYIIEDGKHIGQLLYFVKGTGAEFFSSFPLGKTIGKISKTFFPIISFDQGPTYYEEQKHDFTIEEIIEELKEHHNITKIQATTPKTNNNNWSTYKINLNQPLIKIWDNIKKSTKKNIKRTINRTTIKIDNENTTLKQYKYLLRQSRTELGMKHLPPCYPNKTLKKYFNDQTQVILIEYDNNPIAAMGILEHNGYILEIGSAISPQCKQENIYAGDLIKWVIMTYGHQKKHNTYDLGGCNPKPETPKEESIKNFKAKFGGTYQEYGVIQ